MATTAAEPAAARRRGVRGAAVVLAGCAAGLAALASGCIRETGPAPGEPGAPGAPPVVAPEPRQPDVRIGLRVGTGAVRLGGGDALLVTQPDGGLVGRIPAGAEVRAVPGGEGVRLVGLAGVTGSLEAATVIPADPAGRLLVDGRPYRGALDLFADRSGLTAVNRLGLEEYLVGVVAAEMGRRDAGDFEALRAQAVVSRTYALRNMGRRRGQGFDFHGTVADQVYAGAGAEYPLAAEAVESTRGQILTWQGAPIDAFFYSTCGGRTAGGTEVFRAANDVYLASVPDVGPDGRPYCRISPRFRWSEEWTGPTLERTLRTTLPVTTGVPAERVREVRDVRVAGRTGSGRVGELAIGLARSEVVVPGPSVRQVLRTPSGEILRSNVFTLSVRTAGRRVARLTVEGSGAGHGVGLCQWGAVGRAREGHDYRRILAAYYQGVSLERAY